MSELTEFFLLLGGLYLVECAVWAPRGAVAFLPWFWSGWRIHKGSDFYGNPRWGVLLGNPAPGQAGAVLSEMWPVSLSPDGVYAYVAQAFNPGPRHEQPAKFYRYQDVGTVEWDENKVLVNGEEFVKTASPPFARRLAVLIRELARLPVEKRAARIDKALRASLDLQAVRARWEEYEKATSFVGPCSDMLFVLFFLAAPLAAWTQGLEATWPMLLAGLVVLLALTVFSYVRAHRRLYPDWAMDRWLHAATMVPLPPAAIRAPAFLARNLLSEFHPLAIARVFCLDERFLAFARALVRDMENPIQPVSPTEEFEPAETERFFRERLRAAVGAFLAAEGFQQDTLLAPPVRDGDEQLSYCPRCHCQFIVAGGQCESCNLPLTAFEVSAGHARS